MSAVLYVEDDEDNAFMRTQRLHRHGTEVAHLSEPEAALLTAAWQPTAAMLLDLNLSRIDGLTVLGRLRADPATRTLPAVVVSASVQSQTAGAAMDAGADTFIARPIDFNRLPDRLSKLIPAAPHTESPR